MTSTPPPPGYVHLPVPDVDTIAVARQDAADGVREALAAGGTLERWAASHPERREMRGRGAVYAVPLPAGGPAVVVRHARHGGLLASLTGDRFLGSGRAPRELDVALRLAAAGVPTPSVVTYVTYPAGPLLNRIDVATEEIAGGLDLPAALERWPADRAALLDAVAGLLARLARAGARHPDLNVKNVLVTNQAGGAPIAHVLDVDRVVFGRAGDPAVATANMARLARSARKWARRGVTLLTDAELAALTAASGAPARAFR
ncbi:MAG TPA: lipopolysaccharide kinase InaA family protein [Gemmatimonadales bacterium]